MADENHLIEIQVGETGADQVASKLGQVDSAADKIPTKIDIIVNAKIDQALANLAQMQQQVAQLTGQASVEANKVLSNFQSTIQRYQSTDFNALTQQQQAGKLGYLSTQGGQTQSAIGRITSSYTPPLSTLTSSASGAGYAIPPTPTIPNPPAWPTFGGVTGGGGAMAGGGSGFILPPAKSNINVSETYDPRGILSTRTITEKGLTDPITGEPLTQRQQEITQGKILADQENALREDRRRQFQSSDTEQYRARRVDASGKPVGDIVGAKAQLDLVNKELASMGSTTSMTSQQLDRYNTLLKRQADLSVDAAGKTKNLGADMLKHAGYVAYAALIWTTFRAVGQVLDESITKQRELTLETAKFAAITGQSVDEATAKWKTYADIGMQAGISQSQLGRTGLIATQMGKGNLADEAMFVRVTTQLEELTGVASSTIAESLSSALRQADKPMSEVAHLGDLIASSLQKIPAAELKDVISALQEAPALAQLWATDFDTAFNIVIEGASRAQEGPENVSGAFMRLSQGLNEIAGGGEKAWTRQNQLLDDFGLKVVDDAGRLRAIPEILKEAAAILPTLSAPRQQEFLSAIAGSTIKPDQLRTIIGGISAFTAALDNANTQISGSLTKMTDVIDESLGQMVKVMDAKIEMLRVRGGILENLFASLLSGTVARYGGEEGVRATTNIIDAMGAPEKGREDKQGFLKGIIEKANGDPEELKRLQQEHNNQIVKIMSEQNPGGGNPLVSNAARSYANNLLISDEDIANAINAGTDKIQSAASAKSATFDMTTGIYNRQNDLLLKRMQGQPIQANLNQDPFAIRARGIMQKDLGGGITGWSGESVLPTNQIDLTKYTQDEINQAKQLSVQLAMQELEIMRAKLIAMELEPAVVDSVVAKRKEELDTTILLLRTQQGLSYETGITASKLQDALSQMDKQKQDQTSLFQFRRLKDVDPSQFGQLQGLTQMYDKFLTSIGSPEKQMNINLLLGEQNTFKTMNARMTALQLALEDLTKVEKAQLSGTWNMPAGSTALVPITSLDLQRWNKSGGGGIDPAALAALLGATNGSGDKVATAMGTAADRITAAIRSQYDKSGVPHSEKDIQNASAMAENAIKAALGGLGFGIPDLAQIGAKTSMQPLSREPISTPQESDPFSKIEFTRAWRGIWQSQQPVADRSYDDIEAIRNNRNKGLDGVGAKTLQSPPVNVSVSMLPVKANFNANLSVNLNGAVVARALVPILYDMLIRTARSTGVMPKGAQRS